jgi:hypothetical protein
MVVQISTSRSSRKTESDHLKKDDHTRREQIRQEHIATAAYFKSQSRGFTHGMELEDWLEAEAEYDALKDKKH